MTTGPTFELHITLHPNGQVQVNGPLADKVLCLGMLEEAKRAVWAFKPPRPEVIVPAAAPPNGLAPPGHIRRG